MDYLVPHMIFDHLEPYANKCSTKYDKKAIKEFYKFTQNFVNIVFILVLLRDQRFHKHV